MSIPQSTNIIINFFSIWRPLNFCSHTTSTQTDWETSDTFLDRLSYQHRAKNIMIFIPNSHLHGSHIFNFLSIQFHSHLWARAHIQYSSNKFHVKEIHTNKIGMVCSSRPFEYVKCIKLSPCWCPGVTRSRLALLIRTKCMQTPRGKLRVIMNCNVDTSLWACECTELKTNHLFLWNLCLMWKWGWDLYWHQQHIAIVFDLDSEVAVF